MGMLSLAGIVSGAGAGAGKSLRQAQTYLNWEMLQEERGKLELQRDELVNENIIKKENRHRAQDEADLLKSQSPDVIKKAAAAAGLHEMERLKTLKELQPMYESQALDSARSKSAVDKWLAQDEKDRKIANLKDPKNKEIYDLTLQQAAEELKSADQAIVDRSQYLNEHEVIGLAYKNNAKLGMTRTQELQLEDLEFSALHRKDNYDATQRERLAKITDRDEDRISRMLTASERTLEGYRKSIAATTNEAEIKSLKNLENQELRLHHDIEVRARKIFGLPDAPAFKVSDELTDTAKPRVGTDSKALGHVREAANRRGEAIGSVVGPVLNRAGKVIRGSGMFGLTPGLSSFLDVPAVSE